MRKADAPVITSENLSKEYADQFAVRDLTFEVGAGEVVGFVGLNGAGKTTTISLMLGFIHASSGSVKLFGRTVRPSSAHRTHRDIGYASGDMDLFDKLTGAQYLRFLEHRYHVRDRTRREELEAKFSPQLGKRLGDLSRGNRQKIALIAAFLHSPKLVILDEPSSGLDPLMQEAFLDLIREERERGTTIFMSSHYLAEVSEVCSRVLCIREGKLIKDISSQELERSTGKKVHITAHTTLRPPKSAERVMISRQGELHVLSFVYHDEPADLLRWLTLQRQVVDFSVDDHDISAEFAGLIMPPNKEASRV